MTLFRSSDVPDLGVAEPGDAPGIAALLRSVADDLTERFGRGHWSNAASEERLRWAMRHGRVIVARSRDEIVGVLLDRAPGVTGPPHEEI